MPLDSPCFVRGIGANSFLCMALFIVSKVQRDKLAACNAYRIFDDIIVGGGTTADLPS